MTELQAAADAAAADAKRAHEADLAVLEAAVGTLGKQAEASAEAEPRAWQQLAERLAQATQAVEADKGALAKALAAQLGADAEALAGEGAAASKAAAGSERHRKAKAASKAARALAAQLREAETRLARSRGKAASRSAEAHTQLVAVVGAARALVARLRGELAAARQQPKLRRDSDDWLEALSNLEEVGSVKITHEQLERRKQRRRQAHLDAAAAPAPAVPASGVSASPSDSVSPRVPLRLSGGVPRAKSTDDLPPAGGAGRARSKSAMNKRKSVTLGRNGRSRRHK